MAKFATGLPSRSGSDVTVDTAAWSLSGSAAAKAAC